MSVVVYAAAPISGATLDTMSDVVRAWVGVAETPFLPIREVLELVLPRPHLFGESYSFEVHERREMGNDHGRTFPDQKRIILREDVYEGLTEDSYRDRFTAAHEFAHLLLHTETRLSRRPVSVPLKRYENPEWQANRLGAALLMPSGFFRKCKSVQEASARFGVSRDAVRIRADGLKVRLWEEM